MDYYDNNGKADRKEDFYSKTFGETSKTFYEQEDPNPFVGAIPVTDENSLFTKVFVWMALALGVSAISAYIGADLIMSNVLTQGMLIGLIVAELILVIVFSIRLPKMSVLSARICFFLYAIVNGLTLSTVLIVYTASSVFSTFIASATMFGLAALWGKVTKKNLTSMGSIFVMGLFGLIIAGVINMFVNSGPFAMIISVVGILLFLGITAWDIQKIKQYAQQEGLYDYTRTQKVIIYGAFSLYLDFINIFLKLLRLMGSTKD